MYLDDRETLVRYVQRKWGVAALRPASEGARLATLPTGLPALDDLLGGGIPAERITALHSRHSAGATTIAHTLVAATQRREQWPVWLDASHTYDPATAARVGVDFTRLTVVRPGDPVETLAAATTLVRSSGFDLIVFDRLAEEHQGLVSTWLGCMVTLLHNARTALLILTTPVSQTGSFYGGRALGHYSSLTLSVRRVGWLRSPSESITGLRTRVTVLKSKTGAPGGSTEIEVHTGTLGHAGVGVGPWI